LYRAGGRWELCAVPEYRLLYFRGSQLQNWESLAAPDSITAIQEVSGRGVDQTVEVWLSNEKLAVIRPTKHSPTHRRRASSSRGPSEAG
jgi:hypothetical protein